MPTYVVHARARTLTAARRDALAEAITALHSGHTGAPRSFVQTIFADVEPGAHYVGGQPTDDRAVWVHGHIRSGRPASVRSAIALGIRDALEAIAGVPREFVWVYLSELAHTDMVEFGSILPVAGAEATWVASLDPEIRDHLRTLD